MGKLLPPEDFERFVKHCGLVREACNYDYRNADDIISYAAEQLCQLRNLADESELYRVRMDFYVGIIGALVDLPRGRTPASYTHFSYNSENMERNQVDDFLERIRQTA